MWRCLLPLVFAHVIGSYGVEVYDQMCNWDSYAALGQPPKLEVLAAPVRIVPVLIRINRLDWWLSYLIPFAFTAVIGLWFCRRKIRVQRGFEVKGRQG